MLTGKGWNRAELDTCQQPARMEDFQRWVSRHTLIVNVDNTDDFIAFAALNPCARRDVICRQAAALFRLLTNATALF